MWNNFSDKKPKMRKDVLVKIQNDKRIRYIFTIFRRLFDESPDRYRKEYYEIFDKDWQWINKHENYSWIDPDDIK